MAIDDYKITNAEVQAAHVQAAPNTLTGTAQENKAVFDGYPELLKEKHNNLIDAIDDALSEKADSSDVEAALAEKADIDDVDTALAEKVDKIEGKGLSANDYIDADKALVGTITNKVDKETGKGLSTNDYTTAEKMKLSGIAAGAEVNVQADWEQSNSDADDYINNKPYIPTKTSDLTNDSDFTTSQYVDAGLGNKVDVETGKRLSTNDYTNDEKTKLAGIATGAEVNVQADWNESDSTADDYIKNKPVLAEVATSGDYSDLTNTPSIPTKTSDLTNDSDYTTKLYVDGKLPTGSASGTIANIKDGADGMPMKSLTATIAPKQSGSGTPSPENVRPISGWESVETSVCGKNLLNPNYNVWSAVGTYLHINGVVPKDVDAHLTLIDKDTNVSLSGIYFGWVYDDTSLVSSPSYYRWCINDGAKQANTTNLSIVIGGIQKLCQNLFVYPNTEESFEKLFAHYDIQVELGTTATDYEPYTATTHTTPLGRTVYGGTVDLVSGQLVDNMAIVDMGDFEWAYNSAQSVFYTLSDTTDRAKLAEVFCSIYTYSSTSVGSGRADYTVNVGHPYFGTSRISVKDSRFTDSTAFKTAMDGVQLCYELATPQTYTLTPQTINTLAGVNNVWADSGDCSIEYVRDIGLALDNLLPDSPTTDGTYTLVCTVSDGKATLAWQSSGASLSSPLSMSSPASLNINTTKEEGDSNEIR